MLPDTGTLLLFMTAALALNVTPGPDMLYVATRSVGEGRAAGVMSSLGIAAGCLVHTVAVALGLAGLLRAVPIAFEIVKWTGAGYLVWLGVRALRTRALATADAKLPPAPMEAIFRQGMLTNVLNPKVALFFLASSAGAWSRRRFGEVAVLRRTTGVLFIGLGVRLALFERR